MSLRPDTVAMAPPASSTVPMMAMAVILASSPEALRLVSALASGLAPV